MSDRGHSPVAAAQLKREAETPTNQIQRFDNSAWERSHSPAEYVPYALAPHFADGKNDSKPEKGGTNADRTRQLPSALPADEATLIEERRKRREAIKARHRGQATPFSVQGLALDATSAPSTPKSTIMPEDNPVQSKLCCFRLIGPTNVTISVPPANSSSYLQNHLRTGITYRLYGPQGYGPC